MSDKLYDLAVIGAGPGGYVGAIRAGQLGLSAVVIEMNKPGGVCLNIGCIPSKALIHQADIFRSIPDLEEMGVSVNSKKLNYEAVFNKSRMASDTLSKGVAFLLKKNKIDYLQAKGVLSSKNEISLDNGQVIRAKNILVATGSSPKVIPGFEFDGVRVLSSDHALMLKKLPESVLILGGGAIGVEFAHIMNSFGVEVHIIEMLEHILPNEDAEIVKILQKSFIKRGIKVYEGARAKSLKKSKDNCVVEIEHNGKIQEIKVETALVVVGRKPNTDGIGLEKLGISTDRGFVMVGDYYQTNVPGVFAIGDIIPSPMLAHVASKEAEIAVEFMAGHKPSAPKINPSHIPGAVYCEPQIASFGLSEDKANQAGRKFKKAIFPFRGVGKAVATGVADGMVKVLYDEEQGEIIGAHIVGADATEMIHEILLAHSSELLPEDISAMIHAHPTLSESVMETMRVLGDGAIHI